MTDLLGSIGGAVGGVADKAADFLLPPAQPGGQDLSLSTVLSGAGQGLQDLARESTLGMVGLGQQALTGEGSVRDRLLTGAMAAFGAGMGARALHQRRAMARMADNAPVVTRSAKALGEEKMRELGLTTRFDVLTPDAEDYARRNQMAGASPSQIQILGGVDEVSSARGLVGPDASDAQLDMTAGFVKRYKVHAGGLQQAQSDLARFARLADMKGGIGGPGSGPKKLRDAWGKVRSGEALTDQEADLLFPAIKGFADVTDQVINDSLTFGPVGRVVQAQFMGEGVAVVTAHPDGWGRRYAYDPVQRKRSLERINWEDDEVRAQLAENVRAMYREANEDIENVAAGRPSRYGKYDDDGNWVETPIEAGHDWYQKAHNDVATVFGVDETTPEFSRHVAAVSFLSEAQDWDRNIQVAHDLYRIAVDAGVEDPDFQQFLLEGTSPDARSVVRGGTASTVRSYQGSRKARKAHEKKLKEIHDRAKDPENGISGVTEDSLKKVLRLWGGESAESVFLSTSGPKQKNFWLNMLDPTLEGPVTVDRHAFDLATGLDFGTTERPISQALSSGQTVYDVLASVYREVAEEFGLTPNQLQAVTWEGWKRYKETGRFRGGWSREDPFARPNLLGAENQVNPNFFLELLNGHGAAIPVTLRNDTVSRIPVDVLDDVTVDGLATIALADGSQVIATDLTEFSSTRARQLTPLFKGDEGAFRWGSTAPQRVQSLDENTRWLAREPLAQAETFVAADLDRVGGHPSLQGGEWVVVEVPNSGRVPAPRGAGEMMDLGRAAVARPTRDHTRLDPSSVPAERWMDPVESPLNTHSWFVVTSEVNDAQIAALKAKNGSEWSYSPGGQRTALKKRLNDAGYHVIEVDGRYGGDPERSFMVIGGTKDDALEIAEEFGQESVITDQGFLYNRDPAFISDEAKDAAGRLDRTSQVTIHRSDPGDFRSEFKVGGESVLFAAEGATFDPSMMDEIVDVAQVTPRTDANVRKVALRVRDGQDIAEVADRMRRRHEGAPIEVYTDRSDIGQGWDRAYDRAISDGHSVRIMRYADGPLGDPHGSHVFVLDASKLPHEPKPPVVDKKPVLKQYPDRNGVTIDNTLRIADPDGWDAKGVVAWGWMEQTNELVPIRDEALVDSGVYDVVLKGKQLIPRDDSDLIPAGRAYRALVGAGYEGELKLKPNSGKMRDFPTKTAMDPAQPPLVAKVRNGLELPKMRRDKPRAMHGVSVDGGYRVGNTVEQISEEWYQEIDNTLGMFVERFEPALTRFGLANISVSPGVEAVFEEYASVQWMHGGAIVLSKEFWADPDLFTSSLDYSRNVSGELSPRVPVGPAGIIAHELGHVLHGAIRLDEQTLNGADSAFDSQVIALAGGKGRWSQAVKKEISLTAGTDPSELVAEAVSEVMMSPNPSPLSVQIFNLVEATINDRMRT